MMPYLVDTNIFLELMLEQKEKNTVKQLLNQLDESKLFISDFSFHSIGVKKRNFLSYPKRWTAQAKQKRS